MKVKELIACLEKADPEMVVSVGGEDLDPMIQVETVEWFVYNYGERPDGTKDESTHLVNVVMLHKAL